MQRTRLLLIPMLIHLILLSGCNRSSQIEKQDPEDVLLVKTYYELLRQGKYDEVEKTLDPSIKDEDFRVEYDALVGTIPAENPLTEEPTLARRNCQGADCECTVVIEYRYANELLLFKVALHRSGAQVSTMGMHIRTIPQSLIEANEFRLSNKGLGQYAALLMAFLFPLVTLCALVACLRSNLGFQKWLWILFILFGVSRLDMNWTTGELVFHLAALQLFSAGAYSEPYGPWTISLSLPIGAILYFATHKIPRYTRPSRPSKNGAHYRAG